MPTATPPQDNRDALEKSGTHNAGHAHIEHVAQSGDFANSNLSPFDIGGAYFNAATFFLSILIVHLIFIWWAGPLNPMDTFSLAPAELMDLTRTSLSKSAVFAAMAAIFAIVFLGFLRLFFRSLRPGLGFIFLFLITLVMMVVGYLNSGEDNLEVAAQRSPAQQTPSQNLQEESSVPADGPLGILVGHEVRTNGQVVCHDPAFARNYSGMVGYFVVCGRPPGTPLVNYSFEQEAAAEGVVRSGTYVYKNQEWLCSNPRIVRDESSQTIYVDCP